MDTQSNIRDLHERHDDAVTEPRGTRRRDTMRPQAASAPVAFGSGWYHDAAIEAARGEAIEARCHPVHW